MSHTNCDQKYKKHLEKCFKYISDSPDIQAECEPICGSAKSIYSKLKACKDKSNWSLRIEPPWLVSIVDEDFRSHPGYLLVGGKIEVRNCYFHFYSFTLSIVTNGNIVRRFHFDINTEKATPAKPKCHMQYGGKATHELSFNPNLRHNLEEWMEKPRLPYPPIDIMILLDFTLTQISTPLSKKLVQEPNWKSLVRDSEKLRLREYYDQVHRYLASSNNVNQTLFQKLCLS